MARPSRKPSLEEFTRAAEATRGFVGKIAEAFKVNRRTVLNWCNKDKRFQDAVDEWRGRMLDDCIRTAHALANGIPEIKDGKRVGWIERPDSYMLRYLIGKYGANEGFGETLDITSKGESIKAEPVTIEVIDKREQVESSDGTEHER